MEVPRLITVNTMIDWRWDQGRVLYFQYNVLKDIARTLIQFENKNVNDDDIADELKSKLIDNTGLPFSPDSYKVNRNYSRVFQCALLSTTEGRNGKLIISDICRELASDNSSLSSADDYFLEVAKRFRYPFPGFQEYNSSDDRVYPFIAILKYLIAQRLKGCESSVSLEEIASILIGNELTGLEDIDFYKDLSNTSHVLSGDQSRQLREMIAFFGQISFLKIFNKRLYLDIAADEDVKYLLHQLNSIKVLGPQFDRIEEFLSITKTDKTILHNSFAMSGQFSFPEDKIFIEGSRKRIQHVRIERSPLLRRIFISLHPEPICNACKLNLANKYPWSYYLIDIHHLLPLSSVIRTTLDGTTMDDLVGLCPTCHRAIHSYYAKWLSANNKKDFKDKAEAMHVYLSALNEIA